eukprot:14925420-Ditylum_brightwellii.AAC.1
METLPLRVCKAIYIHKGQGISVGPDGLSQEELFKIDKRKSPDEKKTYIVKMEYFAEETQKELIQTVIGMDNITDNTCFDGGFKSLK